MQQLVLNPHLTQISPVGKVYLVANHPGALVGIEQCSLLRVSYYSLPSFLKEYKGRILMEGYSAGEVMAKLYALPDG